jgi:hypothetical protein
MLGNKNKLKRSQLKMGETISIIIVFFILIFSVFIIYANQKSDKIKEKISEKEMLRSVEMGVKAAFLPEIQCSESQCIGCTGAMDMLKLDAVSNYTNAPNNAGLIFKSPYYFQDFGYSIINVEILYPSWEDLPEIIKHNWTIYEKVPNKYNEIYRTYTSINIFDPFNDRCYFGVMEVATFS